MEPIQIRHGQLEGKDVAYMPYRNETWTTEFMGVAMETGEGKENTWKMYVV